ALEDTRLGRVAILLGNGDGTFGPALTLAANSPNSAIGAGEFNGDGLGDLIITESGLARLRVYLSDGTGGFEPGPEPGTGTYEPGGLAVADFNGDGRDDVAVTGSQNSIAVYLANGHGGFTGRFMFFPNSGFGIIAAIDFDHDGRKDLVFSDFRGFNPGIELL